MRLATRALFEEESEIGAGEAAADLLLKAKPFEFGPLTETWGSKNEIPNSKILLYPSLFHGSFVLSFPQLCPIKLNVDTVHAPFPCSLVRFRFTVFELFLESQWQFAH